MTKHVAVAFAACLSAILSLGPALAQGTLAKVKDQSYVTMGFTNELPYSFAKDGKLTGGDTVVIRKILADMGIKELAGVLTEFQSLIPGLRARRFDMNSTMYIRPARCKQILFTDPIWMVADSVLVRADRTKRFDGFDQVAADPSIKVGFLAGAAIRETMMKAGVKEAQAIPFPDQPSAMAALKTRRIDGFANTALGNQALLDAMNDPEIVKATPFKPATVDGKPVVGYGALGFRLEDRDFYEEFNAKLAAFVGTPEHLALVRPFGFTEVEVMAAKGVKAADLCKE